MAHTVPTTTDTVPHVRSIGLADLRWALAEGWSDFKEHRGDLLMIGFLYPLVGLMAAAFALNGTLMPLLFPLIAGLSLMGPTVAVGFYELARRREQGLESGWTHFLDPWRGPAAKELLVSTIALALLFLTWLDVAAQLYQHSFGFNNALTIQAFLADMFTTAAGLQLILFGNLVGLGFAIIALAVSVVTFPMLVDRPVPAATAAATSLRATVHNPATIALWGLIVAALLVIGSIPLFIGLAVVMPVLGYATWHLYTRLIER
ncbi:DUF2189 domain-containing protein [Flavisphingomonas formosensis]|uniref:DUF2189 domain-containing protein n=1 Tax=Flavisphingomonas formosensis TaxID=861534 RepID=UPI0012FB5B85|nr:DUF2189 domain-containing protein [Sphingomonas formosensis]